MALLFLALMAAVAITVEGEYCKIRTCSEGPHPLCDPPSRDACGQTLSDDVTSAEQKEILDVHNRMRQRVASGQETRGGGQPPARSMPNLQWSDELAKLAQIWTNGCTYGHDGCRDTQKMQVGQNIAWAYSSGKEGLASLTDMMNNWYNEVEHFRPEGVRSFSPNNGPTISHYTQIVWAKTTLIGCGVTRYNKGSGYEVFFVCNYGPSGNFLGEPVYEVGTNSGGNAPTPNNDTNTIPEDNGQGGFEQGGNGQGGFDIGNNGQGGNGDFDFRQVFGQGGNGGFDFGRGFGQGFDFGQGFGRGGNTQGLDKGNDGKEGFDGGNNGQRGNGGFDFGRRFGKGFDFGQGFGRGGNTQGLDRGNDGKEGFDGGNNGQRGNGGFDFGRRFGKGFDFGQGFGWGGNTQGLDRGNDGKEGFDGGNNGQRGNDGFDFVRRFGKGFDFGQGFGRGGNTQGLDRGNDGKEGFDGGNNGLKISYFVQGGNDDFDFGQQFKKEGSRRIHDGPNGRTVTWSRSYRGFA